MIVTEKLYDQQYIQTYVEGFEAWKENVKDFTPEEMAPICGIDADTLREVARAYARAESSIIFWGMGVSQHTHGTDNARCLIALALIAPLIAGAYGWRIALISLALPGVIGAFAFRALAADAPRRKAASSLAWADVVRVACSPVMWLCCALQFARFTVVIAFIVWLPSLLVADHGFSVQSAGLIVGIGAALTAASNFVGGYASDRLRNPPLVIGGTFAVLACACWMLGTVQSLSMLYVAIALAAIFLQFYFGAIFLVPVEALGPRLAGTATGAGNLFANIGGFLTAYAFGAIKDHAGSFGLGYRTVAIICVAGVVLSYVLARVRTRALAHSGAATH